MATAIRTWQISNGANNSSTHVAQNFVNLLANFCKTQSKITKTCMVWELYIINEVSICSSILSHMLNWRYKVVLKEMVNTSSHFRNCNEEYNFIFWSASALPSQLLNALHPYISIHFLHTALYTFPKGPTRRICITIKGFLNQWLFSLFSWPLHLIQRWWCGEKLEASHS